jgi:hypothetical protein
LAENAYQKVTRVFNDMQVMGAMPSDSLLMMPEAAFEILSDNYLQFFSDNRQTDTTKQHPACDWCRVL